MLEGNEAAPPLPPPPTPAAEPNLLSPPCDWPACFAKPKLKSFIGGELGGRKVRLSERPPEAELEATASLSLSPADPLANAMAVREALGYDVLGGFAVFERTDASSSADVYVGRPHYWNVTTKGLWVDLTPRAHDEVVLVESGRSAVAEPSAELLARLPAIRSAHAAAQAEREASRKAARKEAKALEKATKEREKEMKRQAKERRRAERERAEAEKQEEVDRINQMQKEQLERADPTLKAEKERREMEEKLAEEARLRAEYEEATRRMEQERLEEEERAAREAEEARAKAAQEEEERLKREAAATKAREERRLAEAAKAAEKAAKQAADAAARLERAGGTSLTWDLQVLLAPITPHKEAGAKQFGVGDYAGAYEAYQKAIDAATADPALLVWPPIESIVLACRANATLCLLKLGRNARAYETAEAALAMPGANGCGKAMLSKLLLRRLTALVELEDDPLEEVEPHTTRRALRDARKRNLTAGKQAPAAKQFAELEEKMLELDPNRTLDALEEQDEQTQKLDEVEWQPPPP